MRYFICYYHILFPLVINTQALREKFKKVQSRINKFVACRIIRKVVSYDV